MPGQIVIVNGTSGSGKSTCCELFARRSQQFWLLYGIDHFLGASFPRAFGHHGERCREGFYACPVDDGDPDGPLRWRFGEMGTRAFNAFHDWIGAAARAGCNIVVDHLLTLDPPILQDCIWRLQDLPVLLVTLKPPYEVLQARVADRAIGKRFANSDYSSQQAQQSRERLQRLRPWFYQAVYANEYCDIEIDTGQHPPERVCELIEERLAQGPGTTFETLRQHHPRPPAAL